MADIAVTIHLMIWNGIIVMFKLLSLSAFAIPFLRMVIKWSTNSYCFSLIPFSNVIIIISFLMTLRNAHIYTCYIL